MRREKDTERAGRDAATTHETFDADIFAKADAWKRIDVHELMESPDAVGRDGLKDDTAPDSWEHVDLEDYVGRDDDIPSDGGRTLREIISAVVEQELAQYPPVSMTPEKIRAMAEARRAARKAETEVIQRDISSAVQLDVSESIPRDAVPTAQRGMDMPMPGDVQSTADLLMTDTAVNARKRSAVEATATEHVTMEHIAEESLSMDTVMQGDERIAMEITSMAQSAADTLEPVANPARKKHGRLIVAAVAILAVLGIMLTFHPFSADVGANKNDKEEIVTEDGVVIEDGGYGALHDGGDVWSTTVWDEIDAAKAMYPKLMIPEYVPEGYEFESLSIEQVETGDMMSEYLFSDAIGESIEIEIHYLKENLVSVDIEDVYRGIESQKGIIYIQDGDKKMATIQLDDGFISVLSNISDKDIVEIVEGLSD